MSTCHKNIDKELRAIRQCSSETVISNETLPDISDSLITEAQEVENLSVNSIQIEQPRSTLHCVQKSEPITAGSCQYENKSSNERTVMEEMSSCGPSVPVYLQEKQLLNKDIIICQSLRQLSSNEDGSYPKHAVDIYVPYPIQE